jgi:hypothetical protein
MTRSDRAKCEGRVAEILTARELVINIGAEHGVRKGQKFAVLAAEPIVVTDPETGAQLDVIDREKVRVEAYEVRPRISICRTFRVRGIPSFATFMELHGDVFSAVGGKATPETLRAADSRHAPPLAEVDSYVKKNDRVVEVEGD